jgi:hypothetical protein
MTGFQIEKSLIRALENIRRDYSGQLAHALSKDPNMSPGWIASYVDAAEAACARDIRLVKAQYRGFLALAEGTR